MPGSHLMLFTYFLVYVIISVYYFMTLHLGIPSISLPPSSLNSDINPPGHLISPSDSMGPFTLSRYILLTQVQTTSKSSLKQYSKAKS